MAIWWLTLNGQNIALLGGSESVDVFHQSSFDFSVSLPGGGVIVDGQSTIIVHENNVRELEFLIRIKGTRDFLDLSFADSVQFEVEEFAGQSFTPILADPGNPEADFANGKVIVAIDTTLTAVVSSYPFSLTAFFPGGKSTTLATGILEVAERPGNPAP